MIEGEEGTREYSYSHAISREGFLEVGTDGVKVAVGHGLTLD